MHTILAYTIAMNVHNLNDKLIRIVRIICRLLCQTQNCAQIKFPRIDLQVPTDQLFKLIWQIDLQVPTDPSVGSYRSICRFPQIHLQVPTDRSVGTYRSTINTSIFLDTEGQYMMESNTLANFATIRQLQREIQLNTEVQYMKESNTLANFATIR